MIDRARCLLPCMVVLLGIFQGSSGQLVCGSYEEGQPAKFSCSGDTNNFNSLSPRIKIGGQYQELGQCDSNGNCVSSDPAKYTVSFGLGPGQVKKIVSLEVLEITREMEEVRCFENGVIHATGSCIIHTHVKAVAPTCEGPVFINEDETAQFTCVSERVFPRASCDFSLIDSSPALRIPWFVTRTNELSKTYPDDFKATCTLALPVVGNREGTYSVELAMGPDLATLSADAKTVFNFDPLMLIVPRLLDEADNDPQFVFPDNRIQSVSFNIGTNPKPLLTRLSVRYSHGTTETPTVVPTADYSWTYEASASEEKQGVFTIVVSEHLKKSGPNFFTLLLDNKVFLDTLPEIRFSVVPSGYVRPDWCTERPPGRYLHPSSCDHWVTCQGPPWPPEVQRCPAGLSFDERPGYLTCTGAARVQCE